MSFMKRRSFSTLTSTWTLGKRSNPRREDNVSGNPNFFSNHFSYVSSRRRSDWVSSQGVCNREKLYLHPMHPEMFDENGQIIPDEVLSVRFENNLEDFQDED